MKHEPSVEPGEKRVDGDAPRQTRGAIGSEATDIARGEAAYAAHLDRTRANYHLDRAILSIAAHGEVGPQVAGNRRPA